MYRQTLCADLLILPAGVHDSWLHSGALWWVEFNLHGLTPEQRRRVVQVEDQSLLQQVRALRAAGQRLGYKRLSIGAPLRWISYDLGVLADSRSSVVIGKHGRLILDRDDAVRVTEWPTEMKVNDIRYGPLVINVCIGYLALYVALKGLLAIVSAARS